MDTRRDEYPLNTAVNEGVSIVYYYRGERINTDRYFHANGNLLK